MQLRTNFDITVASELMAVLALSTDLKDMRQRIARIVIGYDTKVGDGGGDGAWCSSDVKLGIIGEPCHH